ncbi:hypothetical protein C7446_0874 [Kushneria sinocarnis]|uniref:Uncharacterized protein n=1 Tax=Kushneria sinocarnis TaxID=595502 RepID=A0A420X098_9GAMM|nr:hypothetical protein [Kushneria sinocarnis]RKR06875.1 hypothetical protein C7446_0874 [Kushneria sinocarnis]
MAASLIVARVDGILHQSETRSPIVQGAILTPPVMLFALKGARLVLADGTVLMVPANQRMQLSVTADVPPTLEPGAPGDAGSDPDVATLQQAIAQGEDPTLIQQAPSAGGALRCGTQ